MRKRKQKTVTTTSLSFCFPPPSVPHFFHPRSSVDSSISLSISLSLSLSLFCFCERQLQLLKFTVKQLLKLDDQISNNRVLHFVTLRIMNNVSNFTFPGFSFNWVGETKSTSSFLNSASPALWRFPVFAVSNQKGSLFRFRSFPSVSYFHPSNGCP